MDVIDLPWLDSSEKLVDAVDLLIKHNRRGGRVGALVTHVEGSPKIIAAEAIIDAARKNKDMPLAEVEAIAPSIDLTFTTVADAVEIETALDRHDVLYGVQPATGPMTQVYTRFERLIGDFQVHVSICRCPRGHFWSPSQLRTPGKCNTCGRPVSCS